ncbi:UTP--glucose-1-phosphate uridylyltransferase GalU [Paenibacillus mesophilus]|uniref:UTP--glucose-1-phosphate uridylyltransferase GalU n=1 Tax=Paenibacillus mesophilus TaxID=2582849 RepID=UPI00110E0E62|nr:UTP--glucose-1-phosphate uridylyltransferase GalU [Paenibacillus mesophilus]TMV47508.1 UTP--glucose-1-phosphate uridylyltransferase GalU [Paenibacillus mesophilus]
MKVRKAIIPAAGLGTRFLPATKAQPKEMLPIVDKPTIQYIVEEAIDSGIEDIMIISGRGKRAIEDHFDKSLEVEEMLLRKGKLEDLEEIQRISDMGNIHYIRQKEPLGLGHAIWCARSFIGNEPFAVLLGDDIIQAETPCLKQLLDVYHRYQTSVVGVQSVSQEDVSKYGIIAPSGTISPNVICVDSFVEKPSVQSAPSNLAIMGRYVLRPEIFDLLEQLEPGAGGEVQLTDAIMNLNRSQQVLAFQFAGKRYDVGDKLGFIKATVDFALQRADLVHDVRQYLFEILEQERVGAATSNVNSMVSR